MWKYKEGTYRPVTTEPFCEILGFRRGIVEVFDLVAQRTVVCYRQFRTAYRPHLQGSRYLARQLSSLVSSKTAACTHARLFVTSLVV